jgi:hypothetical protein
MRYQIVKWADYQHYKDRCPPWIKLHFSLLSSRTWVMADDASRSLMIVSMLLASHDDARDGSFDGDEEYVARVGYLKKSPNFKALVSSGFLTPLYDALADASTCEQKIAKDTTETETETETDHKTPGQCNAQFNASVPDSPPPNVDRSDMPTATARRVYAHWRERRLVSMPGTRPAMEPSKTDLTLIVKALSLGLPCEEGETPEQYCMRAIDGVYSDPNGARYSHIQSLFRNAHNLALNHERVRDIAVRAPEPLTSAQKRAIADEKAKGERIADMRRNIPEDLAKLCGIDLDKDPLEQPEAFGK